MPDITSSSSQPKERYTHGQGRLMTRVLGRRTVSSHAAFFTPYLKPGMSLLDCGCGPGSITLGFAQLVAPGEVVGVDLAENQLEYARVSAAEQGLANVRFEPANVYELPFPDNTFDVVFSHAVVEHLGDPMKALKEMRRVLKPGGLLGVRDADRAGELFWPPQSTLVNALELWSRLLQRNGADPFIGRRLRSLLDELGMRRVEAGASYECHGNSESVHRAAETAGSYFSGQFAEQVVALGWIEQSEVEQIRATWRTWSENPHAFWARSWCEVVGWKE
jgi:ubiquinone/menaquinone biosynthesis C-methylase UbiE